MIFTPFFKTVSCFEQKCLLKCKMWKNVNLQCSCKAKHVSMQPVWCGWSPSRELESTGHFSSFLEKLCSNIWFVCLIVFFCKLSESDFLKMSKSSWNPLFFHICHSTTKGFILLLDCLMVPRLKDFSFTAALNKMLKQTLPVTLRNLC